jgi:hypothetical protein
MNVLFGIEQKGFSSLSGVSELLHAGLLKFSIVGSVVVLVFVLK